MFRQKYFTRIKFDSKCPYRNIIKDADGSAYTYCEEAIDWCVFYEEDIKKLMQIK